MKRSSNLENPIIALHNCPNKVDRRQEVSGFYFEHLFMLFVSKTCFDKNFVLIFYIDNDFVYNLSAENQKKSLLCIYPIFQALFHNNKRIIFQNCLMIIQ